MTDQVRKLLAGYATNTLTEAERKSLFEAALNDQELFDVLHEEQALKDLLDDAVSRAQIRQALEEPHPVPARAWWTRWWAWTGAVTAMVAVAATVTIVAVRRQHVPAPGAPIASVSTSTDQLKAPMVARDVNGREAPRARRVRPASAQTKPRDQIALATPPAAGLAGTPRAKSTTLPAPPPASFSSQPVQVMPSAQQAQAVTPPAQSFAEVQGRSQEGQTQTVGVSNQQQSQIQGGVAGGVLASKDTTLAPLSFTLLKRDDSGTFLQLPPGAELTPGDAVRINVFSSTSGYLSLSRENSLGNWILIFPASITGLTVAAKTNYTIPDAPITVEDTAQTYRLTLVPASPSAAKAGFKARTATVEKKQTPADSLVVDFTISPRAHR